MKKINEKEYAGKKICVIGSGKSGVAAAAFLKKLGGEPFLFDENDKVTTEEIRKKLPEDLADMEIILKELPEDAVASTDLLVPSPGVPVDTPLVDRFREKNIPIYGEIEIAYRMDAGDVIAITGTNGKTTTTTLVGDIMKAAGRKTFVVGNIGTPYTDKVMESDETSVSVIEVSSFQLETIDAFHPVVSAVLNVTPDHLNRHHTMENYAQAKFDISKNQTKDDVCVLNADNEYTAEFAKRCPARVVLFSSHQILEEGIYLDGEVIYFAKNGSITELMNIHDMHLVGTCNVENVCAAIAMTDAAGVPMDVILDTVKNFRAVEHRIEYVDTVDGVEYYNDSKGTNPDAAIQGIRAMSRPTVLIGGGYDKGNTYDEWIEEFGNKVKLLVLIGQTKDKIAECARAHGFDRIETAETFEEAFRICVKKANSGDAVLLSPACASWGMFKDYEERGRIFKDMVRGLKKEQ